MNTKKYWDLFLAFFKPGTLTFGGGPSAIPLIQKEVVDNFNWLTIEEFTDALALGNSLPGPIATKMAALVGYRVGGWIGALVSLIAIVAPTALAIILIINIYIKYKEAAWLKGMMIGVRPVVVILVSQTVWSMSLKSFPNISTWIVAAVAIIGLAVLKIHPAIMIVTALTFGGVFYR